MASMPASRNAPRAPGDLKRIERGNQRALAAASHRDGLDHRHAELARQRCAIEREAAALRQIAHVERDDHRDRQPRELEHQAQGQPQIGRIEHADDQLGRRLAAQPAGHHIARDRLIERGRHQAVGTRQIDHAVERGAARRRKQPSLRSTVTPG